jgi:hypothetical protein
MALPYLATLGWQAEVLAVAPEFVEAARDEALGRQIPPEIPVHRVPAISPVWARRRGWGSLARRAYSFLRERGFQLLAGRRFDLVFFSTSQFGVLPLGLEWLRRTGTPYVLDFQDEWVSDYYGRHPLVAPPGGRFKYTASRALAALQEGPVVRNSAGIVTVSERYKTNLLRRHRRLVASRLHVLPFGGAPEDFESDAIRRAEPGFFRPGRGINWVYVGRGGPAMELAARAFFMALSRALQDDIVCVTSLRLHCLGTAYATGDRARPTFAPLAKAAGVASLVHEETARLPHFTALRCLRDADAIIVFGSDDPGYAASKIMPCLFARRPLLGIFHESSDCVRVLQQTGGGTTVTFSTGEKADVLADRIFHNWFAPRRFLHAPDVSRELLAPHTAFAMTRRLCAIFDEACVARCSA